MSLEQRETIKSWSSAFMKILLGVAGSGLSLLYYNAEQRRDYERDEFKRAIDKIEVNTTRMSGDMNTIQNTVHLIEYRINQVERNSQQ